MCVETFLGLIAGCVIGWFLTKIGFLLVDEIRDWWNSRPIKSGHIKVKKRYGGD